MAVHRTLVDEGPAYGAALLGGVAAGVFADVAESNSFIELRAEAEIPNPDRVNLYQQYHSTYRRFYPATAPLMHQLADLAAGDSDEAVQLDHKRIGRTASE
jgi:xylulokinase